MAEVLEPGGTMEETIGLATAAYNGATAESQKHLLSTHPVRLGLALNFSVFQHEVLGQPQVAIEIARVALEAATKDVSSMPEAAYHDAVGTMTLLHENLELWAQQPVAQTSVDDLVDSLEPAA